MNKFYLLAIIILLPSIASAQSLQSFLTNLVTFLGNTIVPALLAIAFLFFVINVVRFFIAGSNNEEGREKAKALAIYGVSAFVLIVVFWGVVNLLSSSLGLDTCKQPPSDYVNKSFVGPPAANCP